MTPASISASDFGAPSNGRHPKTSSGSVSGKLDTGFSSTPSEVRSTASRVPASQPSASPNRFRHGDPAQRIADRIDELMRAEVVEDAGVERAETSEGWWDDP